MFTRTIALGVGLLGAVALSQAPEFAQQYTQRLGGAVNELRAVVARFDQDARAIGLNRPDAISRLGANDDELARRRGAAAAADAQRLNRLEPHYAKMRGGDALERLVGLGTAPDGALLRDTFEDFQPAMPVTVAGALAAATGFLFGMLAVFGISRGTKRLIKGGKPAAFKPAVASPAAPAGAGRPGPAAGAPPARFRPGAGFLRKDRA